MSNPESMSTQLQSLSFQPTQTPVASSQIAAQIATNVTHSLESIGFFGGLGALVAVVWILVFFKWMRLLKRY